MIGHQPSHLLMRIPQLILSSVLFIIRYYPLSLNHIVVLVFPTGTPKNLKDLVFMKKIAHKKFKLSMCTTDCNNCVTTISPFSAQNLISYLKIVFTIILIGL